MVAGEVLGELPARELVGADDAVHDAGLLEHHEVAVHRALREVGTVVEDLGDRERPARGGERVEQRLTVRGEPLAHGAQPGGDGLVHARSDEGATVHQTCSRAYRTALPSNLGRHRALHRAHGPARSRRSRSTRPRLLIAAHAHPDLDVDARLAQLDALAARAAGLSAGELSTLLFVVEGFRGNESDYGDPRNSFLDDVLDRQLGIPITLSVVMLEVGRRCGLQLHGVGMPGHFLVGGGAGEWFDPFHGGARLDLAGCAALFAQLHADARFRAAVPDAGRAPGDPPAHARQPPAHVHAARPEGRGVGRSRLRLRVPGITLSQRGDLAGLLGRLGQFAEAARELDVLAQLLPGEGGEQAAAAAAACGRAPTERPPIVRVAPMAEADADVPARHRALPPRVAAAPPLRGRATALLAETCLRGDGRFGVVLIERGFEVGGGDQRFGVGTVARIVEAARTPDGRYLLATVGTERFRVEAWLDDDPFPRAEIDVLGEPKRVASGAGARRDDVQRLLGRVLAMSAELGDPAAPVDAATLDDDPVRGLVRGRGASRRSVRSTRSACSSSTIPASASPASRPCSTTPPRCSSSGSPEADPAVASDTWIASGRGQRRRARTTRGRAGPGRGSDRGVQGGARHRGDRGQLRARRLRPAPGRHGSDTFEREKDLSILEQLESELAELQAALERVDAGTYGVDEVTGEPIDPARLDALPTARTNVDRRRHPVETAMTEIPDTDGVER